MAWYVLWIWDEKFAENACANLFSIYVLMERLTLRLNYIQQHAQHNGTLKWSYGINDFFINQIAFVNIVKCQDSTRLSTNYNIKSKCSQLFENRAIVHLFFSPVKYNSHGQLLNKNYTSRLNYFIFLSRSVIYITFCTSVNIQYHS